MSVQSQSHKTEGSNFNGWCKFSLRLMESPILVIHSFCFLAFVKSRSEQHLLFLVLLSARTWNNVKRVKVTVIETVTLPLNSPTSPDCWWRKITIHHKWEIEEREQRIWFSLDKGRWGGTILLIDENTNKWKTFCRY